MTTPEAPSAPQSQPTVELEVLADCAFRASVGWGDCFACAVRQVLVGRWAQPEMLPCVAVGSAAPEGAALLAAKRASGVRLRFRFDAARSYGPPSGLKGLAGGYYELLGIAPP